MIVESRGFGGAEISIFGSCSVYVLCFFFICFPSLIWPVLPPNWISVAAGAYDILRERHRTFELELEYKFHIRSLPSPLQCLEFIPLVGIMTTAHRSGYLYGGINFDFLFFDHLLISPGFAAGYFWKGKGKQLGYPLEFRSGIELAWQCSDFTRLGIHFYHLSNASIGSKNPGEESFVFYYDVPIK